MQNLIKKDSTEVMKLLTSQDLDNLSPESYLNSLTPEQISFVFSQLDKIEKFFGGVRKIIEKEVLEGAKIPNLEVAWVQGKATEGLSQDTAAVVEKLHAMGLSDEEIYKPLSLVSYTDIKKMIKTAGYRELKDEGLIVTIQKDPVQKVVYIDPEATEVEE